MDLRRLVIGGLVLGAALAGCSGAGGDGSASARASASATTPAPSASASTTPDASPSADPSADARAGLAAAARKLGDDTMRVRLDAGSFMTGVGVADPERRAMQFRMQIRAGQPMSIDVRNTGKDVYLKFGGQLAQSIGDQWLRVKGDRLPVGLGLGSAEDPGDAQRLLQGVDQIRRDGPRAFRGTLDMSKSPTTDARSLRALGAKARAIPFTANLDAQGRLVNLTIRMDAANPALPRMTVRYFDFGTPVTVSKPGGRIVDAPEELIRALGGGIRS